MAHHNHHLPKPTFLFILLVSVPLVLIEAQNTTTSEGNNATDVKVGVILDTSSWTGGSSWSCMQLALDDFYASHPNYTTRISLVLRDLRSNGGIDGPDDHDDDETDADAFGAAVAALDLLKNVRVHAIIGPQTSSQVKFIVGLGNKSNVPVISFSAKFPSTSFSQTPYFYRTSWNDSSQAKVIASIAQTFKWREVVPVYEDNDSGNMFVPYLVDTLQEIDAHVLYRCKIPSLASESEINATLDYMNANRTRVFVVHMSKKLALKFFTIANAKNMLTDEYVWITTYGLTDIVDILGSNASNVMQGVLGIRPLVPENTSRFDNASIRLRNIYKVNSRPTVFDLWAYDTVWLLAESVEHVTDKNLSFKASNAPYNSADLSKIGVSEMGPELKDSIENTNFSGISGDFKLVNGQLQSGRYEITNVIGRNNTRVGIWNGGNNLSINWPGNNLPAPKGWQWPVTGGTLLIGVPSKLGFKEFVERDLNASHNFSGYSIEVFQAAIDQLPYNVNYRFEEYTDSKTNEPKGDYDELVYQVYLKKYDAVVGDITILANRSLYVDFTLPYAESGVRLLVPIRDVNKKSPWAFLKPWTAKLWITAGGFFLLTGITVWFVEHRVNEGFRGGPSNQVGSIFYFAFSTLVFAHKEKLVSNLSRVVVITWVFVVLILQQSYTASLSSTLTVEQLQATVTGIEQVIKAGKNVGYLDDSFMPALLKRLGVNESKMISLSSPDTYNEALSNGTVAAVVDEIPYLKVFLKKYQDNYTMVGPTYKTDGFGFAFPKGSPLQADISRAILNVTEGSNMTKFDQKLYGNRTFPDKEDTTSSTSLTFHSFMGLFLLTGATSILALIIHMILAIYEKHNNSTGIEAAQSPPRNDDPREENRSNEHATPLQDFGDIVEINIMSTDCESDAFEELTSYEGTPGREIANSEIEMPSFGDVLNHPEEEPHE